VIATIHQPDFFPWLGLFDKLAKVDSWIVLDHVKNNPRDAAFWGRRVRLLTQQGPIWLSVPLCRSDTRGEIGMPINEMKVNVLEKRQLTKSLEMVRQSYSRHPYFDEHFHLVERYFSDPDPSLMGRNMNFMLAAMKLLGVSPAIVYSSTIGVHSSRTTLLADLLEAVGATRYLCGQGARDYQDDTIFAQRGIKLSYNNFAHPLYDQHRRQPFVPGLSLLDALFSIPLKDVSEWLTASRKEFRQSV
jgi:hypothetical protein